MYKTTTILILLFSVCSCSTTQQTPDKTPSEYPSETVSGNSYIREKEKLKESLSAHMTHIVIEGDPGDWSPGCKSPIVMSNVVDASEGSAAQKVWLESYIPGYRPLEHALAKRDSSGRQHEAYKVMDLSGDEKYVCFDITSYF